MSFSLAGRLTLVILYFLSLAFLVLSHSHPSSSPRDIVYPLEARQVTVTSDITTTIFATDTTVTVSDSQGKLSSTSTYSSRGSSSSPASILSTSSTGHPSSSSSSQTRSHTHRSSRTSSTFSAMASVSDTPTTTSIQILVPTPLISPPSTTFVVNDHTSLTFPTSPAQTSPASSASTVPVAATSTGFLGNKGAVGGTFAVVSLIIAGILGFLFVIYLKRIKKIRSPGYEEGLSSNLFGRDHSWHDSTASARSLSQPPLDPFAAGEVVQVSSSVVSFHAIGGTPTSPSAPGSRIGHGFSDDGHTSSLGHSSSNHHGFSSISYRTGLPEFRANTPQAEPPLFQQLPDPVPPPIAISQPRSEDPFSNVAAVPLYANMASSTYATPPYRVGQLNNLRQVDSDASYYANQMHSYYDGGSSIASTPPPRSYGQAL